MDHTGNGETGELPDQTEPANLRFLRRLVTVLTAVMIFGILGIFALMALRLNAPSVVFPDDLALPADMQVEAMTRGPDYLLVVTKSGRVFVMSPDGQAIRQELMISP